MSADAYEIEKLNVLVADDHPHMRKAICKLLQRMGFVEIHEANDGTVAEEILGQQIIDIALLDLFMPTDGFYVIDCIRNRSIASDIPIIVVTGEANKEDIVKAYDCGADDYVLKPFQASDLEKKIHQLLQKYHAPGGITQRLRIAERLLLQKRYKEAITTADLALETQPDSQQAQYIKAHALHQSSEPEKAIQILETSIKQNELFYKNYSLQADIFLDLGEERKAADAMMRELELNSKNPKRHSVVGLLLLRLHDHVNAMKHFREALKHNNRHASALFGMGKLYAAQQNLEKSLYYFKRLRRVRPNSEKSLNAAVKTALDFDDPQKAEYFLRDEKKQHPERYDTYLVLTKFYVTQKNELAAVDTISQLLIRKPDFEPGLRLLYDISDHFKEPEIVTKVLRSVIDRPGGKTAATLQKFAESLLRLGKVTECIDAANQALPLADKSEQGRLLAMLADCHLQKRDISKTYFILLRLKSLGLMNSKMNSLAITCKKKIQHRRRNTSALSA